MSGTAPSLRTVGALIALAAMLLAIALARLTLTYDLSFFLPPPTTDAQRVLVERLGQGPGTQLVFAVLPKAGEATSKAIAARLREQEGVARVLPESSTPGINSLPRSVWEHRLLLGDLPQSVEEWQATLDERSMDAMMADDALLDLIAADPAFASINALEAATSVTSANSTGDQPVFANESERYLLIQTAAGAFDMDNQEQLIKAIRATFTEFEQGSAKLYGSGVYGVDLQAFVQREAIIFSGLACFALAMLILFRFRSPATALAVGTPLIVGGALGLFVLALVFDAVHGITIAFGFTLLGVAIDYPLHLFSHRTIKTERSIWPTLSLGIASTLIAYLAFIASGTPGMQQLGVFATAGILGAAGSAFVMSRTHATPDQPLLSEPGQQNKSQLNPNQLLWLLCLAGCGVVLLKQPLFSNNLSDLTPVPKATLAEDARLRNSMGVADLRYLISVRQPDQTALLNQLEQVTHALDESVSAGHLASYQSISSLLPGPRLQQQRKQDAQNLLQSGNFDRAVENSEFDIDAFAPFTQQLQLLATTTADTWVTPERLKAASPELAPLVDSMLYTSSGPTKTSTSVALIFLRGLAASANDSNANIDAIQKSLAQFSGAELIDLKQASMSLVGDYRARVFLLLGSALIAIAALLLLTTRNPRRVVWLLGTVAGALALSLTTGSLLLGGLSLFDVIALALVAGLGLDYALFFSRPEASSFEATTTQRAVTLCAFSSLLVFGILSFSNVPLLRGLGITVASGVAGAYILARWGRRARAKSPENR